MIARDAAILRNDSELVPLLRLRITDVDTNLGSFVMYDKTIRDGLRAVAQQRP